MTELRKRGRDGGDPDGTESNCDKVKLKIKIDMFRCDRELSPGKLLSDPVLIPLKTTGSVPRSRPCHKVVLLC